MVLMTKPHKDQIGKCMYEMTQAMIPDGVLKILRGSSFTLHDEEYVNAGSTRSEKVDRLLNRVLLKGDEVFDELVAALRTTGQNDHADMLDPTSASVASGGVAGPTSQSQPSINPNQLPAESVLKDKLQAHYASIVKQVEPKGSIFDAMIAAKIIPRERVKAFKEIGSKDDRCRELLDLLLDTTHPTACQEFITVLMKDYKWLADDILKS